MRKIKLVLVFALVAMVNCSAPIFAQTVNDYYQAAQAKSAQGDHEGALAALDTAIKMNPKLWELYDARGKQYAYLGKLKEAYDDFTAAIGINPNSFESYSNRSTILADGGHYALAVADADAAIKINPNFSSAYSNRARAESMLGHYEKAVADCDQAILLDPKNTNAYNSRGAANYKLERYADAIADYSKAIELDPAYALPYNNRGLAKQWLNDYRGAIADHTKAIELNPKYTNAYYSRALSFYLLQDWQASLADFRQLLARSPQGALAKSAHHFIWILRHRLIPPDQAPADSQKEREAATAELKRFFASLPGSGVRDWPSRLADFLSGALTEQELLAAARTDDEKTTQGQLGEAHYFAGLKRLIEGDRAGAIKQWERAVALKAKTFESRAAAIELANVQKGRAQ
jgi:tetratricopeptide (TPR) repeat protein